MNVEKTNLSITEEWNLKSVETIFFLQERFHPYEWWILQCSSFGTKEVISILFPLVAGFSNVLGVKLLWAVILSEWSNLILKWLFKGDRPYWWMHQHSIASNIAGNLNQFPSTCESGPGTPSGHLMLHVAASFVIMKGLSKYYVWGSKKTLLTKCLCSLIVYLVFDMWIVSVFVSRLYIQAHFIHQCIFGVLMGLLIGSLAWNSASLTKLKPFGSTLFANFLVGSSFLTYGLLLSYGLDPLWAVPLALQFCERPEYVNIDTQPYYIMVRFSAMALGLGFAVSSKSRKTALNTSRSTFCIALTVKGSLLIGKILSLVQGSLPQDDLILYLATNFFLQLLYPYIIISIIPYLLHTLYLRK